jgi:murein DD-endopeptidase MepM/ murein hydrolase activator NlpD
LKIGQRIVIPQGGASAANAHLAPPSVPAASASYGGFHITGPGDTLTKIANRYRVSLVDLAKANRIPPHAQIKLGDRLAIPAKNSAPPRADAAPASPTAVPPKQVASADPQHSANLASPTQSPEADAKQGNGGTVFRWPVRGRIVAAFGAKTNGQHNDGINISVPEGTPIKAAEGGVVAYAGNELKGYGNLILVRHPNGFVTAYAHASELLVKRGDTVTRGQVIAKSGRTGAISAPQLHFEIRKGSTPVDPTPYLGV